MYSLNLWKCCCIPWFDWFVFSDRFQFCIYDVGVLPEVSRVWNGMLVEVVWYCENGLIKNGFKFYKEKTSITKALYLSLSFMLVFFFFFSSVNQLFLLRLDECLGKNLPWTEDSVGKNVVTVVDQGRNLGCCCTSDNFSWWKRSTLKKAHSVDLLFFLSPLRQKLSWLSPFEQGLKYRTLRNSFTDQKKRFALLTSCWLPVELKRLSLLVVVAFGYAVACHQMAQRWWIHFQGKYIEHFDSNTCRTLRQSGPVGA